VAYVRFAIRHRAHFEVMFRPDLYHADDPELVAARDRAGHALYAGMTTVPAPAAPAPASAAPAGQTATATTGVSGGAALGEVAASQGSPGERQPAGVRAAGLAGWSIAHGFATLWVSGAFPDLPGDPDEIARAVLGRLPQPSGSP
jgi:hypothetical protein